MTYLMDILNLILAALALGLFLWALRQRALLKRLHRGLTALRDGRSDLRLQQGPEDTEPVLKAFDNLAQELSARIQDSTVSSPGNLGPVLNGLCAAFRPPLVAIQSYVALLAQDEAIRKNPQQQDCVNKLRMQINGLLRLLESPSDLSALRQGLSGLRREIATLQPVYTSSAVLLVDEDGAGSRLLSDGLEESDCRVLVAPGADAALIMTRAVLPKAVLVNGEWADGMGWRVLVQLKRLPQVGSIPLWLYQLNVEAKTAALIAPSEIWLWPPTEATELAIEAWKGQASPPRLTLSGEPELATQLRSLLATHGLTFVDAAEDAAPVKLDRCCVLTINGGSHAKGRPVANEYVLVVPESTVADSANELAKSFVQATAARAVELAEFQRNVIARLGSVENAPPAALLGIGGLAP